MRLLAVATVVRGVDEMKFQSDGLVVGVLVLLVAMMKFAGASNAPVLRVARERQELMKNRCVAAS